MTPADAYMQLARFGIKTAQTPSGLRSWWESERAHRNEYGLSQEQIDELVQACKDHIATLVEDIVVEEPKPTPRRHATPRSKRRPLI